ncbi:MAG: peptidoglycan DD-metalloendopeptidase family protein, partial [Acidimicrobiia bacterium]|nr:peptidoglycan DD-metalloendopeptidase family protein [Acidimicrobiia bacterium]
MLLRITLFVLGLALATALGTSPASADESDDPENTTQHAAHDVEPTYASPGEEPANQEEALGWLIVPDDMEPSVLWENIALPQKFASTMVFPYPGDMGRKVRGEFFDAFNDPRGGGTRQHAGQDLMAPKMVKVLSIADGVVVEKRGVESGDCCWMIIDHGGWWSWYLHLNNDTPGTDDGQGNGIVPGIEEGTKVVKGQHIGWVGDSGNAEYAGSHTHLETRVPADYDSEDMWAAIPRNGFTALKEAPVTGPKLPPDSGAFTDDDGNVHEKNIEALFNAGITKGCNPPDNTLYCPKRQISRGEIAAFIRRLLKLPASETDHFTDDGDTVFADDIDALAEAGIAFGCTETEYCPTQPLLRDEMAEFMVRTFAKDNPEDYQLPAESPFTDTAQNRFAKSIDRVANAGVTKGCNPPDNTRYCP